MNNIQALVDGMGAEWQRQRAKSQMTLGKMIDALAAMPADAQVAAIHGPQSYRGYYCDLAFEPADEGKTRPASELLAECRFAMGGVFEGYKGGEYQMGRNTPVWVASYGTTGVKLMGFNADGTINVESDDA